MKEKNDEQNWTSKIEKVEQILEKWNNRKLSLFGKVQIIKHLPFLSLCY